MVRAKFRVTAMTETGDQAFMITLRPVTSGSPENDDFFKWTPGGCIELATINEKAAEQFQVGSSYYIDFTKAE